MSEYTPIPVVCFDTNILIQMKGLVTGNPEELRSMRKAGFTKSIEQLYKLVKHGKIIPVITPTVLKEVLHGVSYYGYDLVDFIRDNNFLVFEVDREHRDTWRKQTSQLATSYCTKLNSSEIKSIRRKRLCQSMTHVLWQKQLMLVFHLSQTMSKTLLLKTGQM